MTTVAPTPLGLLKSLWYTPTLTVDGNSLWFTYRARWSILKAGAAWYIIPPTSLQATLSIWVCWNGFDEALTIFKRGIT